MKPIALIRVVGVRVGVVVLGLGSIIIGSIFDLLIGPIFAFVIVRTSSNRQK